MSVCIGEINAILRKLLCHDLPDAFCYARYLFDGICFHFHIASREFHSICQQQQQGIEYVNDYILIQFEILFEFKS